MQSGALLGETYCKDRLEGYMGFAKKIGVPLKRVLGDIEGYVGYRA